MFPAVPIFVHLLHGYSRDCYSVGIEFPLNLNLDSCNPVNEISAFFTRYSQKVPAESGGGETSQNIEQFVSDTWERTWKPHPGMHIFPPENEVELCTNLQIGNSSFGGGSDVVSPPPSPQLWIYHTLRLGHNNFPSRNWKWGGRGGYLWKGFLLTDGLVVGVKEDSDDIAHSPLFTVGFAKSSKDLFLTATRLFDVRTENCFKMSTLIHRKPRRHRLHQEWHQAPRLSKPNPQHRNQGRGSPPRSTWW